MNGIVETSSRGGGAALEIENAVQDLAGEFQKDGVDFRKRLLFSVPLAQELLVTIIGGVALRYIFRLLDRIEEAHKKIEEQAGKPSVRIEIVFQKTSMRFELPSQRKAVEAYAKKYLQEMEPQGKHFDGTA